MKVGFIMPAIALAAATTVSSTLLAVTPAAYSQEVGVYDSGGTNNASYKTAFLIENYTGATIRYRVKWSAQGSWKLVTLPSGYVETHTSRSGDAPYVQFDKVAGDGSNYTPQQYLMKAYTIGYAGDRQPENTQPKRYFFQFSANGRRLDLFAR